MKKQVLLLFAALLFNQAAYSFSAVAPSGQTLYYSIIGSTSVEVVYSGITDQRGDLVIPDSVTYTGTTYQVTRIGNSAFDTRGGLTSVIIPASVTSIGNYAFHDCSGLTSVTIGNSVTSIGEYAFNGCSGLTSVTIPTSVTSIGHSAFLNCSGLTSVTIGNSVTSIDNAAFGGCSRLTSVTIPNSVISIVGGAFSGCSGLTSVTFNADYCTSAGSSYYYHAFINCPNITSFTFGSNVRVIPSYICYGLTGLTSITIPDSVTTINEYAFSGCSGLTSVTIGNSVTSISQDAFRNCYGLTAVHYNGTIGQWCGIDFASNPLSYAHHLYINNAEVTSVTIPTSVTNIGGGAFSHCSGLTSVNIPTSVNIIGNGAFSHCSGLTSVTFNADYCTSAGTSQLNPAFSNCSNITSFTFGNNVRVIPPYLCYGLTGLTSVIIPNSVTSIGYYAFWGCNGLTSVTIPTSVTSIGGYAFSGCSGLISITFLASIPPQLGNDYVFDGVSSNIPVYIPCGSLANYVSQLPYFTNYIEIEQQFEFSAVSADENMGTVQVLTEPTCPNPNAVLNAVPANGYRFDHWSTGSTDNPYTLTVTNGTTIIGYFVANSTQGIGDVGEDDIHISVSNGHIHVEGVADEDVRVYDITGRMIQNCSLPSGVYIVKIGTLPAQKVVVMR